MNIYILLSPSKEGRGNWLKKNCNFCNRNHFWGKSGVDSAKD